MAFSAVILGTMVSLAALVAATVVLGMPIFSSFGLALAAGQTTFVLVLVKALICQSLRSTRPLRNSRHG